MKKLCLLLTLCFLAMSIFIGCKGDEVVETPSTSSDNLSEEESSPDETSESEPSEEIEPSADLYQRDLKIYTDFLKNGGYEQLYIEGYKSDDIKGFAIETKLFDLELNDGSSDTVYELFIRIRGLGAEHISALLTIENQTPKVLFRTENYGGSMGGDYLEMHWDTQLQKYAVVTKSSFRDGRLAQMGGVKYYTADNDYSEPVLTTYASVIELNSGSYDEEIAKVKNETSLYEEDGEFLTYYMVNEEYVTKADYENAPLRFEAEGEHSLTLTDGSFDTPIK